MIHIVTASAALQLENLGFLITGFSRCVKVYSTFEPRETSPGDLVVFVGVGPAVENGVSPTTPYAMGSPTVSNGCAGIVIPRIPADGSVEQFLARRAVWMAHRSDLALLPFGDFYGDTITTPDGSRHGEPLSGAALACVQWLAFTLGHYPSLDEQAAAVASWEIARHNRIRAKANGWTDFAPILFQTMAQARRTAADLGIDLAKVSKEKAPGRWNVTTAEAMIPILFGE